MENNQRDMFNSLNTGGCCGCTVSLSTINEEEAFIQEFLEILKLSIEDMFPRIMMTLAGPNLKPHNSVLPVSKRLSLLGE